MTFTLRRATLADAPALSAFASRYFPDAAPDVVPRDAIAAFIAENLNEQKIGDYISTGTYEFTLAENPHGEIMGYFGFDLTAEQPAEIPGRAAYLSKFYLSDTARGTGLARTLMDAVIEDARAGGYDGVHLGTHQLNHRAQAFYERAGFVRLGERFFDLAPGVRGEDYIYHLPLTD